eukprot:GSMAST32.ASY1.ANO1.1309.1 assembled CDS
MCMRWEQEDLDAVAFGFLPVPAPDRKHFLKLSQNGNMQSHIRMSNMTNILEASDTQQTKNEENKSINEDQKKTQDEKVLNTSEKLSSNRNFTLSDQNIKHKKTKDINTKRLRVKTSKSPVNTSDVFTTPKLSNNVGQTFSKAQKAVRDMMSDGFIFLGMIACRLQPKTGLHKVIDDVTTAGIRFVVFSEKSFRQAKPFAAKMGLDTGWNTAISLSEKDNEASKRLGTDRLDYLMGYLPFVNI